MKTKFWSLALTLILTVSVYAQPKPDVLILPIELPGYYNPIDSEDLASTLKSAFRSLAPDANLQLSRTADLTAFAYQTGKEQPPTPEAAGKLCRAYGSNYLCWVSIRFQPDYQQDTGALALAGAARFWGYSNDERKVIFDQSLSLVRVGEVDKAGDEAAVHAEARKLADGCISDLAYQIVGMAQQRKTRPPANVASWSPPPTDPATQTRAYKTMIRATQDYQRAVKNQSVVDLNSTWAALQRAWVSLNQQERNAIAKNYPDLKEAMIRSENQVYNYGGYGFPGYYMPPVYPRY
jgi:hypothetical protein